MTRQGRGGGGGEKGERGVAVGFSMAEKLDFNFRNLCLSFDDFCYLSILGCLIFVIYSFLVGLFGRL